MSLTNMRRQLEMEPLEERLRLILIYKVVEGLVPALPADNFIIPARPKRTMKAKTYSNCETDNIMERQVINNTRGL